MLLLNASGCLDALTAPDVVAQLDAFVTKTVTPEARQGNPPVRIAETEHGMLNSIGLANPGRDVFLRETLPRLADTIDKPIWVSVGGFCSRDYVETCEQLARDDVACVELNLSCPNVDEAPESAAEIVRACREVTANPLYAKVSPHTWDMGQIVRAVEEAGADGVSMVNTLRGVALDARLQAKLARGVGGYSGPALKPVALAAVLAARRATSLPIVAMGGVQTGRDALELIACGATHVALGTVLFTDVDAPSRVCAELVEEAQRAGFERPDDAFCVALDAVAKLAN
ncbi:MAG TPA: dihydroorotate dehydrogenase catalytic subunit [Gaiellaceae bacterium]|nr:dihydroorotate dehydrogenase catalytic subunit [Gaiellaceae bacterium]